ncbi:MAG: hypothetical protein JWM04_2463 [Verrucomicrobiales bacterium]|nr:hypothetical protein [Verrucomicrobiales bacterium]
MLVICPVFNKIELLPFYLKYYEGLGATEFVVALWNGQKNPLHEAILQTGVDIRTSVMCDMKDYNGPAEIPGLNAIREELAGRHGWYCIADLDEFFHFGESLPAMREAAEKNGFQAVHGIFHDRVAPEYEFPSISESTSLDLTFPLECDLTRVAATNNNKICMAKKEVRIESGHHYCHGKSWNYKAEVHHFKWRDGIMEQLAERDRFFTAQGLPWSGESSRFLKTINEKNYLEQSQYNTRPARIIGI